MREAGNAYDMKERKEGLPLLSSDKRIRIDYRWMTQWKAIVLATALIVCVYTIYTLASPSLLSSQLEQEWKFGFILRHFFIDIFAIELITTTILFHAIRWYANRLAWHQLELSPKRIGRYLLEFLPLFLCIFFLINPITQTIRYWWNYYPNWHADIYYAEYFYSLPLYLRYLIPIFLLGYGVLVYNLIRSFNLQQSTVLDQVKESPEIYLEAYDEKGEKRLPLSNIWWIEVEQRRYFAVGKQGRFRLRKKLNELELQLQDHGFFRINRAVLVNWQAVDNCSFWENEKYILRLQDGKEFVMPRQRWVRIKEQLKQGI